MGRRKQHTPEELDLCRTLYAEHESVIDRNAKFWADYYGRRSKHDPAELKSIGLAAAFVHAHKFNPEKGGFSTFIVPRIKGAIIDYMRTQRMFLSGGKRNGRTETRESLGADVPSDEFRQAEVRASLELRAADALHAELREQVEDFLSTLRPSRRRVIEGYFLEFKTMRECGVEVGLTQTRISQIIDDALTTMRLRFVSGQLRRRSA